MVPRLVTTSSHLNRKLTWSHIIGLNLNGRHNPFNHASVALNPKRMFRVRLSDVTHDVVANLSPSIATNLNLLVGTCGTLQQLLIAI